MEHTRSQLKVYSRKRNREQMGIDNLDDDILSSILSRLSLKESGRTSVLGRRWRYLWRSGRKDLHFDHRDTATGGVMERGKFICLVNNVLRQHKDEKLDTMLISFVPANFGEPMRWTVSPLITAWVYFAMRKEVQRFEVHLSTYAVYYFPSLSDLISRSHACFHRLRTLRLTHVRISEHVIHYLLEKCIDLEELCIQFSYNMNDVRVMYPPRLRVLEIRNCCFILKGMSVEVSAVNLVQLTYGGLANSLTLKDVPSLRELCIGEDFCGFYVYQRMKGLSSLVHLEKLVLDFGKLFWMRVFDSTPDLPQLCSLKWLKVQVFTGIGESLMFFATMIKACPLLCEFRIELSYKIYGVRKVHKRLPFCGRHVAEYYVRRWHRNLKVVEMTGFLGSPNEQRFVLELLTMGSSIERVVIDTENDHYDDPGFIRHCSEMAKFGGGPSGPMCMMAATRNEAKERARLMASKSRRPVEFIII